MRDWLSQTQEHVSSMELALVGALALDPSKIDAAMKLRKADFFYSTHGDIFEQLLTMRDAKLPVADSQYLLAHLLRSGLIGQTGNCVQPAEFAKAINQAIPNNVEYYVAEVLRYSQQRSLMFLGANLRERASMIDANPADLKKWIEAEIGLMNAREDMKTRTLHQCSESLIASIKAAKNEKRSLSVMTGLPSIDLVCGGLCAGDFVVLAARPSSGKTAMGMQWAMHSVMRGKSVLFFSLEMTGEEYAGRVLYSAANVQSKDVRMGRLTDEQIADLERNQKALEGMKLEISDTAGITMRHIKALAKVHKAGHGLDLLLIDYLQLVKTSHPRLQRNEQIAMTTKSLKEMAKELGVPVVVLSQLNREAEKERPTMKTLAGSDAIASDADMVFFIHNPDKKPVAEVIIGKCRASETGIIRLGWDGSKTRFYELDTAAVQGELPIDQEY